MNASHTDRDAALGMLEACEALNRETDDVLERAISERWPLRRTVAEALPLLAAHTGAGTCWLGTRDEDGEEGDFTVPVGDTTLPTDRIRAEALARRTFRERDGTRVVLGQPVDVAGETVGTAAIRVACEPGNEDRLARLLDVWCEQVDNYIASIARARRKHEVSKAISTALKHPILDVGIGLGMQALRGEVDFDDMVLLYRHDEDSTGPGLGYKVWRAGALVHDSSTPGGDASLRSLVESALTGDPKPLLARLGIERYREEVLISGLRDELVIGKMIAATRREEFNTFDRDILERFADFLRQRVVDFNKDWRNLSQCFPRPVVTRLLATENYARRYLEPVERDTVVMFCDISGFTRVSEQVLRAPSRIGELIDRWSEQVVRIIWDSGGVFDKMVGDCVIGLWGPPFWEEDARVTCRRAIEAAHAIRAFTATLPALEGFTDLATIEPPLGVSTGLNHCPLFVGRFGPNDNYTGFSSGMNNTARLQGVADRDEILCMESMVEALGEAGRFGEPREARVKNVAEPLRYRALLD